MKDYMLSNTSASVCESRAFYEIAARIESLGKEWRDHLEIDVSMLDDSTPVIDYAHLVQQGEQQIEAVAMMRS
ncbi:unnamed protein product [Heligmosomoides polygyrus]|uniref:EAL domain-containing protein n=1 Tax=Heligmosomoides polygyrus TaxID=6339 RepID=A0A183GA15_HELPZ|nr:unnamed protein product [Heligmosomoides polygyrus]